MHSTTNIWRMFTSEGKTNQDTQVLCCEAAARSPCHKMLRNIFCCQQQWTLVDDCSLGYYKTRISVNLYIPVREEFFTQHITKWLFLHPSKSNSNCSPFLSLSPFSENGYGTQPINNQNTIAQT